MDPNNVVRRPLPAPSPVVAKKQFGNQVRRLAKKQYGAGWQQKAFGGKPKGIYGAQRQAYSQPGSETVSPTSVQSGVTQANRRFQRFGNRLLKSQRKGRLQQGQQQRKPTMYSGGIS